MNETKGMNGSQKCHIWQTVGMVSMHTLNSLVYTDILPIISGSHLRTAIESYVWQNVWQFIYLKIWKGILKVRKSNPSCCAFGDILMCFFSGWRKITEAQMGDVKSLRFRVDITGGWSLKLQRKVWLEEFVSEFKLCPVFLHWKEDIIWIKTIFKSSKRDQSEFNFFSNVQNQDDNCQLLEVFFSTQTRTKFWLTVGTNQFFSNSKSDGNWKHPQIGTKTSGSLLRRGADPNELTSRNRTALDLARGDAQLCSGWLRFFFVGCHVCLNPFLP